jgi:UDP-glucuronate decarboxylase
MNEIIREDIEDIVVNFHGWEKLQNKVVLISGANGFLPAYMVEVLMHLNSSRKVNVKVLAQVRNFQKANKRFAHLVGSPYLEIVQQDVCSPYMPVGKIDFIVHAASQASPKFYGSDPVGTLNANVLGTNNLLEIARSKQVERFLYFSSSEVYGQLPPEKIPTSESDYGHLDPTNVRACYAEGKRMGETMCVSWSHQYHVPVSIVRPFHTYGPGMDLDDGRVYADFISDIVHGKDIVMKSDGSAIRAFCYISDAVKAFFTVLLNGRNNEAYNVGNDEGQSSIIDLAQQLVQLFPDKGLKVIKQSPSEGTYINSLVSKIVPNVDKLKLLGWNPETCIKDGFIRTIRSYL